MFLQTFLYFLFCLYNLQTLFPFKKKCHLFVLLVNNIITKSLKINHNKAYNILFDGIVYNVNINTELKCQTIKKKH